MFDLFVRIWKWRRWSQPRQEEMAELRALQRHGKGKKKQGFKQRPIQKRRIHRTRKR